MTNAELIERIDETVNILAGALKLTDGAEVSVRAPWLRELAPAQMVAIIDHYDGRVHGYTDEPWGTITVDGIAVFLYGATPVRDTRTAIERLRAAAASAAAEIA